MGSFGSSRIFSSSDSRSLLDVELVQLLEREVAHLGIAALDQLLGVRDLLRDRLVLAVLLHERLDLRQRLGLFAVFVGVALDGGRAERGHQLFVLALDGH